MVLSGRVEKKAFAPRSKSAHDAVFLVTETGQYVLRRQGGNPFRDPELEKLVGKTISCTGDITGYTFLMSDWREIKP